MDNLIRHLIAAPIFLIVLSLTTFGQNATNASIEENWLSVVEVSGIKLRLALRVSKTADGSLAAKFDSIDQESRRTAALTWGETATDKLRVKRPVDNKVAVSPSRPLICWACFSLHNFSGNDGNMSVRSRVVNFPNFNLESCRL